MGDSHLALHSAFHPANSRGHSARSLERCGVLPKTPVGEAAGDQCELYKVGRSAGLTEDTVHSSITWKTGPHMFGPMRTYTLHLNESEMWKRKKREREKKLHYFKTHLQIINR